MNNITFRLFVKDFVAILRERAPEDTGNLKFNAINYVIAKGEMQQAVIFVEEDIAPYMPYTNEPWISPKWNGEKNPNEKWFNEAVEYAIKTLSAKYNGVFRKE